MQRILAPSILEADYRHLASQIKTIEAAGGKYIHIDMMDGVFVPNISFGMPMIKGLREATGLVFDVHMMVIDPIRYVVETRKAGADIISIHHEACTDVEATLVAIRMSGAKCGIVIKPDTPVGEITDDILNMVDVVQVMSVAPGIPNQRFQSESIQRIRQLADKRSILGLNYDIEVDGNINPENVGEVLAAGANIIVAGGAIFNGDIEENIKKFLHTFKEIPVEETA